MDTLSVLDNGIDQEIGGTCGPFYRVMHLTSSSDTRSDFTSLGNSGAIYLLETSRGDSTGITTFYAVGERAAYQLESYLRWRAGSSMAAQPRTYKFTMSHINAVGLIGHPPESKEAARVVITKHGSEQALDGHTKEVNSF